jgi:tRNA A-37 threonylcarbamoyl transferase component Bud32
MPNTPVMPDGAPADGTAPGRSLATEATPGRSSGPESQRPAGSYPVRSWSGLPPPPEKGDPLLGKTLNATYSIERMIGEGGMGRVYEASHTRIRGKSFAVKVLHSEYVRQPQVRARFYREAEAAALISNSHVVGVYDVGETDDGQPYLVAEFLEGRELGEYLDAVQSLPVGPTVHITRQVCNALAAAHARGVVHRDIKPENVFLTGDANRPLVKVLDFGISRLEDKAGSTLTKTGMIMGTPSYMAPEQARGERVDHRADLYAVGAILYRALTGVLPFEKDDPGATVVAVLTEEPARPRFIDPTIPEPLELIVQRAMAKNPDERFQSMDELDQALAPYDLRGNEGFDAALAAAAGSPAAGTLRTSTKLGAQSSTAAQTVLGQQASEIRMARPMLGLLLALAAAGVVGGLVGAICSIIRLVRGGVGANVTGTEAALVLVAVLCTLLTPGAMLVRHLRKTLWNNTAKVVALVDTVKAPLLVGIGIYGMTALVQRLAEVVVLGHAVGLAWPGWDLVLFLFGLGGAGAVLGTRRLEKSPTSTASWDRMATTAVGVAAAVLVVLGVLAVRGKPGGATLGIGPAASGSSAAAAPPAAGASSSAASRVPSSAPPGDSSVPDVSVGLELRKLVGELGKQIQRGELQEAISSLERLAESSPGITDDSEARGWIMTLLIRASMLPDRPEAGRLLQLLTGKLAPGGLDILYEVTVTRGGTAAANEAARVLEDERVRARGSAAMRIAWELRHAKTCDDKIALFDRAKREGDGRAVTELQILKSCSRRTPQSCCLRDDNRVKEAIAVIQSRPR